MEPRGGPADEAGVDAAGADHHGELAKGAAVPDDRAAIDDLFRRLATPWRMIARSLGISFRPSLLLLATVAALVSPAGWRLAKLFLTEDDLADAATARVVAQDTAWPGAARRLVPSEASQGSPITSTAEARLREGLDRLPQVYSRLARPFRDLFRLERSIRLFAYNLCGGLWSLIIWGMIGGVVARVAVVELGCDDRIGVIEATRFVGRRYAAFALAPLFPMTFVVLIALGGTVVGLMLRAETGVVFAGILWIFVILGGTVLAVLLIALVFGWPLMWGTLAAERFGDVFEAAQRSWAYTYGRPIRYLYYALIAVICGALGWILAALFTDAIVHLSWWSVSWGAGQERLAELNAGTVDAAAAVGLTMITFLQGLVRAVLSGFSFSFFWCAASAIYLLLRRDVDQTHFDEIFREGRPEAPRLPELDLDDAGVPGAAEDDAGEDPAESH